MTDCTPACEAAPTCTVCKLTKPPRGRDVAPAMAGGRCGPHCTGYYQDPLSGHLWPGELGRRGE